MPSIRSLTWISAALAVVLAWPASAAEGLTALLRDIHWGESADALVRQFGTAARRLPQPLDFGDSYADVVLEGDTLGGVPVAVFFQMDKVTHGLKRVQLEPLGHEINPPAYRAIAAALNAEYGQPTQRCITPPVPDAGFQAAVEERWQHDDAAISAIFRDTTLQAFEGCLYGPASGWCGLHGQILVRISPAAPQSVACAPPAWPG
ncbi:MAG: hypothetical protein WA709_23620 [Stellaceae bacterium]